MSKVNKRIMGLMNYLDSNKRGDRTKKQVACEINTNPQTLSSSKYIAYQQWLKGKNNVKPSMYRSIAKAFNINPSIFTKDLSRVFDEDGNLLDEELLSIMLSQPYHFKDYDLLQDEFDTLIKQYKEVILKIAYNLGFDLDDYAKEHLTSCLQNELVSMLMFNKQGYFSMIDYSKYKNKKRLSSTSAYNDIYTDLIEAQKTLKDNEKYYDNWSNQKILCEDGISRPKIEVLTKEEYEEDIEALKQFKQDYIDPVKEYISYLETELKKANK